MRALIRLPTDWVRVGEFSQVFTWFSAALFLTFPYFDISKYKYVGKSSLTSDLQGTFHRPQDMETCYLIAQAHYQLSIVNYQLIFIFHHPATQKTAKNRQFSLNYVPLLLHKLNSSIT